MTAGLELPMSAFYPVHKLGTNANVLLTSVFGPYAQDDEYGSRELNPMELYHNQVTRTQGAYSLRMFHRSFGLMLIQENVDAPVTLLDFPSLDRFIAELKDVAYDIIGISSIIPNFGKVQKMCELIREHQPKATIVVGGHVANMENVERIVDADHIALGEGVRWFRQFLGQNPDAPIKHPAVLSGFASRTLGMTLRDKPGDTAAILIPSVGCPIGCDFCCTSALFGGKGKSIHFYETGDELFQVMCDLEEELRTSSFFALDENFLLYRKRALRLLELMKEHDKSWSVYIFSSAKVIRSYTMEQLLGLGVSWVWMGLEGEKSQYEKIGDLDTKQLVRDLQDNGVKVLGSSIIGMDNHTPENIHEVIDYAVSHDSVFHQFMLYTPSSGTPLHKKHKENGTLLSDEEVSLADAHGQSLFKHVHPHIKNGKEGEYLVDAFNRDIDVNGPSLSRLFRVTLNGYLKHKNHPDKRIRNRVRYEGRDLAVSAAAATWAMARGFKDNAKVKALLDGLLKDLYREFGVTCRLLTPLLGTYVAYKVRKEERRLACNWKYEPQTFYEKNAAATLLEERKTAASRKRLTNEDLIPTTLDKAALKPIP